MNRRTATALGIVATLAIVGAVTDASAGCNPPKGFTTAFATENYFLNFPADANSVIGGPALKGRFWQAGNRAGANESGACPEATYLTEIAPGQLAIFGSSGADVLGTGPCDNQGCVAGNQVTLIQTTSNDGSKAYYAVGKVSEDANGFDYARGGTDWDVVEVPRPRVTQSSRAGSTVTLNLNFDAPLGAHGEADAYSRSSILTGYQVVRFEGSADPGRAPGAWTNLGAVIPVSEGGATLGGLAAVCGGTTDDVFIAMRPVFDGGQFSGDYVGASTRIECDPAVADPRFKMIDRTKSGRGSIRSNPR
jgi:hypothetical protein